MYKCTCTAWFSCSKFFHTETSGLLNSHTDFLLSLSLFGVLMWRLVLKGLCCHFLFRLKHGNHPVKITVTVCGKFHRSFPRSYNLEVLCTYGCACAVRVCECEIRIAAERQSGYNRAWKLCFLRKFVYNSPPNLCTSSVCVITVFGFGQTFLREKWRIFERSWNSIKSNRS